MSMFRTPTSQRSFSELPLDLVGQNIMSYLTPKEKARLAISTGSFLPVSQGYYGRGSNTEMHREYMRDRKDEYEECMRKEREEMNTILNNSHTQEDPDIYNAIYNTTTPFNDRMKNLVMNRVAVYGLVCTLEILIDQGRINLHGSDGIFLLMKTVDTSRAVPNTNERYSYMNSIKLLKFLLENGANPNQISRLFSGHTLPIIEAIELFADNEMIHSRGLEVIKILLDHGADPTYEVQYYNNDHMMSAISFAEYLMHDSSSFSTHIKRQPFITACLDLFDDYLRMGAVPPSFRISTRKATRTPKRKTTRTPKRKSPKRKASKRKAARTPKRKTSKRKASRAIKRR